MPDTIPEEYRIDPEFLNLTQYASDFAVFKAREDYVSAVSRYAFRRVQMPRNGSAEGYRIEADGRLERARNNAKFQKNRVAEQAEYGVDHAKRLAGGLLSDFEKKMSAERDAATLRGMNSDRKVADQELADALAARARIDVEEEQDLTARAERERRNDEAAEKDLAAVYARVRPIFLRFARARLDEYDLWCDQNYVAWQNLRDARTLLAIDILRTIALLVKVQRPANSAECELADEVIELACTVRLGVDAAGTATHGVESFSELKTIKRLLPGLEHAVQLPWLAKLAAALKRCGEYAEYLGPVATVLEMVTYSEPVEWYRTPEDRARRLNQVFVLQASKMYLEVGLLAIKAVKGCPVALAVVTVAEVGVKVTEYFWERHNRQIMEDAQRGVDGNAKKLLAFLKQDSQREKQLKQQMDAVEMGLKRRGMEWAPYGAILQAFLRKHSNVKAKATGQRSFPSPQEIHRLLVLRDHKGYLNDEE